MSFYVSTATFILLHCDEWDRVVALPRHKFVTGATLLQLGGYKKRKSSIPKNRSWLIFLVRNLNHVIQRRNVSHFHR